MSFLKSTLTSRSLSLTNARSGVVYQLHRTSLNARAMREAAEILWQKIKHLKPEYLVAPGLGAAPIAAAIAQAAINDGVDLETLAVRDPAKSRKNERLVEGFLPQKGQSARCVFVDDTITTGSTYRAALQAVSQAGMAAQWVGCAIMIDAWHPHGSRQIDASGVPVFSALRRHDVGLTRDASAIHPAPFNLAKPLWVRHGLVGKPEHPRKAIPAIWENYLLVATDDCTLHCFNLLTGDTLWVLPSSHPRSKGCGNDLQVQPDGTLVYALYDGSVTRLRVDSGRVLWSRQLTMAIHSAPAVMGNQLFVATEDLSSGKPSGRCVALDYTTGNLLWQHQCKDFCPTQTAVLPCGLGGIVAWASNDCQAHFVFDDGTPLFQWPLPSLARGRPALVTLADGQPGCVFACESGEVVCFDVNACAVAWQIRHSGGFNHSSPIVIDNRIFVTDHNMHLIGLCATDGHMTCVNRLRGTAPWRPTQLRYQSQNMLLCFTEQGHASLSHAQSDGQLVKVWETKASAKNPWPGGTPAAIGAHHLARFCSDGRLAVFSLNEGYSL